MSQSLPRIQPRDSYSKYLHILKKNHHSAKMQLETIRAQAAEFEKTLGNGFIQYKDLTLTVCNGKAVRFIDNGHSYESIKNIIYSPTAFHRINSILDAITAQMSNEIPVVPPTENSSSPLQIVQNQTQSQSQNIQLIMDVTKVIAKSLTDSDTTPEEKTFLQKVEEILPTINGGLDLLQKVSTIAAQLGIGIEGVSRLFH